jgi:aspartokinase-like uncharacterized kinase
MEAVIKLGGSLAEEPKKLKALCQSLSTLAKKRALIVVPGGGRLADVVKTLDRRFMLSSEVAHRMAILAMDQFGLLLSCIMPYSCVFHRLENAKKLLENRNSPIFLPSKLMFEEDPLENSWDVTSDSIAAYVASRVSAKKLVLVTDVDGIFTSDPKNDSSATLIKNLSVEQLLALNRRTSVDRYLPKLLLDVHFDCYVVNGLFPKRVEAVLEDLRTICTLVNSRIEQ